MRAKAIFTLTGVALGAASLCGCASTSTTAARPALTETASLTGSEAGFALALPDTVSVVPEPSGLAPSPAVQIASAEQPAQNAEPVRPASFAGSTPQAPATPAVMTASAPAEPAIGAQPAVTAQAGPIPVVRPLVADGGVMPGVQPAVYVVPAGPATAPTPDASSGRGQIEQLIEKYAALYEVPVDLVRHVVNRESTFNPKAYNRGHWGLMQIKHATARGMGYDGPARGLFDAETNLKYAVKYLRGAWLVSGGDARRADRLYQTGYYYQAKRKGLLDETGLGTDRGSRHRMKADEEVRLDPEGLVRPPVLPVGSSS